MAFFLIQWSGLAPCFNIVSMMGLPLYAESARLMVGSTFDGRCSHNCPNIWLSWMFDSVRPGVRGLGIANINSLSFQVQVLNLVNLSSDGLTMVGI